MLIFVQQINQWYLNFLLVKVVDQQFLKNLFRRYYKKNRPKTKNKLHHVILHTKNCILRQSTRKNKIFAIIV